MRSIVFFICLLVCSTKAFSQFTHTISYSGLVSKGYARNIRGEKPGAEVERQRERTKQWIEADVSVKIDRNGLVGFIKEKSGRVIDFKFPLSMLGVKYIVPNEFQLIFDGQRRVRVRDFNNTYYLNWGAVSVSTGLLMSESAEPEPYEKIIIFIKNIKYDNNGEEYSNWDMYNIYVSPSNILSFTERGAMRTTR